MARLDLQNILDILAGMADTKNAIETKIREPRP